MKVVEFFESIQGEGKYTGHLAIFLRLQGCVLNCSFCDTKDIMNSGDKYSDEDLYIEFEKRGYLEKLKTTHHLVITGGSPLFQQDHLFSFINLLNSRNCFPFIEIENETVIMPKQELMTVVHLWNNSVKLSNSGMLPDKRIKRNVIDFFLKKRVVDSVCWKFVISDESQISEVKNIVGDIKGNVYIMPEGKTRDEIITSSPKVIDLCLKYGYNFSPREHIIIWNTKKGV